jgi:Nucleotidyl transferase AbiEii toxin, Type IV TA system
VILGERHHFTRDHFETHKGTAPSHLAELVVHCLELVSQLAHHGLKFRFKGGNSLLILLEDPQRFSIDVDIVTTESKENLVALVDEIVRNCDLFTRSEARAPKTKPWLPMISFKLFFASHYQPEAESYVMLDAVLEPPPYPGVSRRVRCGPLYRSALEVEVPSVSGLIGDKLLTIGPKTLGIPLGKGKEAQRLKHVFDVSLLSRQGFGAADVRASIDGCMVQENRIQGRACAWDEVARDTAAFLEAPLAHPEPPPLAALAPDDYLYEIVKGFEQFRTHLFRVDYTWEMLRDDCRRVRALLDRLP